MVTCKSYDLFVWAFGKLLDLSKAKNLPKAKNAKAQAMEAVGLLDSLKGSSLKMAKRKAQTNRALNLR